MLVVKKGFHYSQDGPGNRLVYHLQGCNMHCPWCANPEAMSAEGTIMEDTVKGKCMSCQAFSVEDILQEADEASFLFFDNGGVTFTGGEPSMQFQELKEVLKGLKALAISTAIETNASHPGLPEIFPYLDTLITDFKHPLDEVHKRVTGVSNRLIRQNITLASHYHIPLWIRTPLIHGFNDDMELIPSFLDFYHTLDNSCTQYELLPYHEYGRSKWEKCGLPYTVENGSITPKLLEAFEAAFRQAGLTVVHT